MRQRISDPGTKRPPPPGFTLVELVVVMALIGIVLFFSLPRLERVGLEDPGRQASRWVVANVRDLKARSLREGKDYVMHVGVDTGRLWVTGGETPAEDGEAPPLREVTLPDAVRVLDVAYPRREKVAGGEARIRFYGRGYSDKAMIHIRDDDGQGVSLLVEPFLAEVTLYEGYREMAEAF